MVLVATVGLLASAACAYYLVACLALWRNAHKSPKAVARPQPEPGISILKPACGAGGSFAELLRGHAAQDYSDFEILVGAGPDDSTVRAAVRTVQGEFPRLPIQLIECAPPSPGCNGKVEVLQELARHASKPVWVLNDADIGVPSDYLARLSTELGAPRVGMVTCLYRAEAGDRWATRLEASRINTEFPAQVLLANTLQGIRFGLGATIALRAETLSNAGGFARIRNLIGEDYHLGARVAASGLSVRLSGLPVRTHLPQDTTWRQSWRRQLRWSRTIRKQRPRGHLCLAFTFAIPWSALALLTEPGTLWPVAATAIGLRLWAGESAARLVHADGNTHSRWLMPAADLLAAAVWICSHFGNEVSWAGRRLRLGPQGRILG